MRRSDLGLLGLGALCAAAISASALGGCQADGNGGDPTGPGGPGGSGGSGGGTTSGSGGAGGDTTSTTTGPGGGGGAGGGMNLPVVTIEDITSGAIGEGVDVEVHGVVAMSPKWLVSKSNNTGSCLWGVFLSAPDITETAPYTGILALSYGTPGTTDPNGSIVCPKVEEGPVGDAFPDDVKPGDVLDVTGETSYFLLNACATEPPDEFPSQIKQRQLAKVSKVERTGTAPVPTPKTLTDPEVALLNSPTDQDFHDQWGGAKVRIVGPVEPLLYMDMQVTWPYGNIYLNVGDVEVGDKVYYVNGSPNLCHAGPNYPDVSVVFSRIDGFSAINFCRWSVQPVNKCLDFDPPGDDCLNGLMCP